MENNYKSEAAYKTIGEVAKIVGLIDKKNGNLQTHTIRYWETQFKLIKPKIRAGRRRCYSTKDVKIISFIKFLLKDRGLTINGAKKILNIDTTHSIDDIMNIGINRHDLKKTKVIKSKIKNISKIIQELKKFK